MLFLKAFAYFTDIRPPKKYISATFLKKYINKILYYLWVKQLNCTIQKWTNLSTATTPMPPPQAILYAHQITQPFYFSFLYAFHGTCHFTTTFTSAYPAPDQVSPRPTSHFFKSHFNIIFLSMPNILKQKKSVTFLLICSGSYLWLWWLSLIL